MMINKIWEHLATIKLRFFVTDLFIAGWAETGGTKVGVPV